MLRLYYAPGASSFAVHVSLEMSGAPFGLVHVSLKDGEQRTPAFRAINPRGRVPALDLGGPRVLTESVAIVSHLAERFPEAGILPPPGSVSRARAMEWMCYLNSTVMATMGAIFRSERYTDEEAVSAGIKSFGRKRFEAFAAEIDTLLSELQEAQDFVSPEGFCAADAYLVYIYRSAWRAGIDLAPFRRWTHHAEAVAEVPAAARAMATEGISVHP
jgi:glutathione S-transferase